jgi:hypothetical protein
VFFTAVLEISELGHKPPGFALYSNAVHFALWALTLPIFTRCIRRFPLKEPKTNPECRGPSYPHRSAGDACELRALGHRLPDLLPVSLVSPDVSEHAPIGQPVAGETARRVELGIRFAF